MIDCDAAEIGYDFETMYFEPPVLPITGTTGNFAAQQFRLARSPEANCARHRGDLAHSIDAIHGVGSA